MLRTIRRVAFVAALLIIPIAVAGSVAASRADDELPDPDDLRHGLIAEFRPDREGSGGQAVASIVRLEPAPIGRWGGGAPDPRLPAGSFSASWTGWILVREAGPHRFRVEADGPVRMEIGRHVLIEMGGAPVRSEAIELTAGLHPVRIDSEHGHDEPRLAVDWEGPGFGLEPIPRHLFYHEADRSPPDDLFEQGRRVADRLGCANCHSLLGMPAHPEIGPPLIASRSIRDDWLTDWIADPARLRPGTAMPSLGLDRTQAADLAAFLVEVSSEPPEPDREARMALNVADAGRGRLLFRSAGCLGCHPGRDGDGSGSGRSAPDLAGLGSKRSAEGVATYLGGSDRRDSGRHRPQLNLSAEAAAHLAAYLTSAEGVAAVRPPDRPTAGDPARGKALAGSTGCASCHRIPGVDRAAEARPLASGADPEAGCLADDPPAEVPRFALDDRQRRALRALVAGIPDHPSPLPSWTIAEDAIRRRDCLGCHSRYGTGGEAIGAQLARWLAEDRELNTLKGTLTPPDLSAVGAKLLPEYLEDAVRGRASTARPWLSVRMPRYAFEPGEAEAILSFLREFDRVDGPRPGSEKSPSQGEEVGITLLGREGFGCVSCHVLDGKVPPGGEAETLGPDLALAHRRMSRAYYDRWLTDPQRIIPGTPMPQFIAPAPGVAGTLDEQLGAIWEALGNDRLAELASTATRQFLVRQGDRPLIVRDMVVAEDTPLEHNPRALAIGLPGDRSLLFDADRLGWLRWWDGGFLYRTKQGRLWEWHPEGRALWTADAPLPPVAFRGPDGTILLPEERRERFGSFAELAFDGDAVRLRYVLNGPEGASVEVVEQIAPALDGWERRVEVGALPPGYRPVVIAGSGASPTERNHASWEVAGATVELRDVAGGGLFEARIGEGGTNVLLCEPGADERGRPLTRLRVRIRPIE